MEVIKSGGKGAKDLLQVMETTTSAMQEIIEEKMTLFKKD